MLLIQITIITCQSKNLKIKEHQLLNPNQEARRHHLLLLIYREYQRRLIFGKQCRTWIWMKAETLVHTMKIFRTKFNLSWTCIRQTKSEKKTVMNWWLIKMWPVWVKILQYKQIDVVPIVKSKMVHYHKVSFLIELLHPLTSTTSKIIKLISLTLFLTIPYSDNLKFHKARSMT